MRKRKGAVVRTGFSPVRERRKEHDRLRPRKEQMRTLPSRKRVVHTIRRLDCRRVRRLVSHRPREPVGGEGVASAIRVLVSKLMEERMKVATFILPHERVFDFRRLRVSDLGVHDIRTTP